MHENEQLTLWSPDEEGTAGSNFASLNEITLEELEGYRAVYLNGEPGRQFAIVTQNESAPSSMMELGTSSPSPWTSWMRQEYNPQLLGQLGLKKYNEMRLSDATVRGSLRGVKTPVLSARYFVKPGIPLGKKQPRKKDIAAAQWVEYNIMCYWKSVPWMQVLMESLLMLEFGYYMFEQVWENEVVAGTLRTVLKKMAPRHPMDVLQWEFDAHGGPNRVKMAATEAQMLGGVSEYWINIDKLVVFTHDREAGDIQGRSILRSAFKAWYFKQQLEKIDAIQKERHSIGIPVIKLPMGFNEADKAAAQVLGRNLRTNERAHVVLPPNWDVLMLKLEGKLVNVIPSLEYHDSQILINVLTEFFKSGGNEDDQSMFLKATRFIADIFCMTMNSWCIPQMVDFNFKGAEYPRMVARRIGENTDWRDLSFAIRNFVGANVVWPDDQLEETMRDELDLPLMDPTTRRQVATPQAPGPGQAAPQLPHVGAPRQSKAVNMQQQAQGTGKSNTGNQSPSS